MKGKGNDGSGDNQSRDEWQTKQEFWDELNKQYNFGFDCCADINNKKTEFFARDFLTMIPNFDLICWMNPPFSKANIMFERFFKVVKRGVCIFRCDNMETKIWQDIILPKATWIFIPKGRISYTPFDITIRNVMTRFPSALIGFNVESPKNIEGTILKCRCEK